MAEIFTVFGDIKRVNHAPRLERDTVFTIFGDVRIDYTRTPLEPGDHELSLVTVFGDIKLRLPEEVAISIEGVAVFGGIEVETMSTGDDEKTGASYRTENWATAAARVHITTMALFGDIKVNRVVAQAYDGVTRQLVEHSALESFERSERDGARQDRRD